MSRRVLIVLTVIAGLVMFSMAAVIASRQPVTRGPHRTPTSIVSERQPAN